MLIAKGYGVVFRKAKTRKNVVCPRSYALLHDPSGSDWPRCGVLIAPFQRKGLEVDYKPAVEYFNYEPNGGKFTPPSKRLSAWRDLGYVDAITYTRPGDKEVEGKYNLRYGHEFSQGNSWFFKDGEYPKLYRLGRVYRLELHSGCVVNWRGFVYP